MHNTSIISNLSEQIKNNFRQEGSGHDWLHIERVWKTAKKLSKDEKVNIFVIEASALLHDVADWKFSGGDETAGSKAARKILKPYNLNKEIINHICEIIDNISFKGARVKSQIESLEGMIVQDADRLDAMGAIGIARAFQYGGYTSRPLYDLTTMPVLHKLKDAYKNSNSPTINHFFEKLLLLKDLMNTEKAKKIAQKRHQFMIRYVKQFIKETYISHLI